MSAAAGSGVLVGAAIVATRSVVDETGPISLALLRYAVGTLCLLPALALAPEQRVLPSRRDMPPIALLGIGQFGLLIVLLNFGLQRIPAAHGALIFASVPLLTMLLAVALGHERLTAVRTGGVIVSVLGVASALGEGALRGARTPDAWLGDLAVLGSAACAAVCSVLYRPYLGRYPVLPVSVFAMLASVLFLILVASYAGLQLPITAGGWLAVAFVGLASGLGYFLWLWALGHISATRVTVFLALSPVTAALLGAVLLKESLTAVVVAGVACVAGGIWLANLGRADAC
jgi:drug/metabolite transporter (DMT)-like permease